MHIIPKSIIFTGNFYTQIKGFEVNPLHTHEFVELLIPTSGNVQHLLNGKRSVLSVGESILLMPGDMHQFLPPQDKASYFHRDVLFDSDYFKQVCNGYSPTLFEELSNKKHHLQFRLSPEQFSQIETYISSFILSKDENLQNLLVYSLATFLINIALSQSLQVSSYPQWITSLLSVLNNPVNLSEDLTTLTKNINFTPSYMCRDFKKHVGVTMTEYFNNQKMYYAHALITTSNLSIDKICELVGVNNLSHFYKLYKKVYGVTPKKARSFNPMRSHNKEEAPPPPKSKK